MDECERAVVEAHLPLGRFMARRFIRRAGIHGVLADEVLSDAYEAMCLLVQEWDSERAPFHHFMHVAFERRLIDRIRARAGRPGHEWSSKRDHTEGSPPVEWVFDKLEPVPADTHEVDAYLTLVAVCMKRLRAREREIVALRLQGLSQAAIGERYGVTESRICQVLAGIRPVIEASLQR